MPPKYRHIADELRFHIYSGNYASASMLPTEYAIAQEYGVSRQTVRQALSLLAQEGLIQRRQGSGSHITRREPEAPPRRTVAIVTTYISDYFFPSLLRHIETVLSEHNVAPILYATENLVSNERRILTALLNTPDLDGILVEGTKTAMPNPNLDLYRKLMEKGIPLVFVHGNYPQLCGALSVMGDNAGGGKMLVEHLHSLGHRRIAGVFKYDDIQGHQRYCGYMDALRELGLPMEDSRVCWFSTAGKDALFSPGPAFENLKQALDSSTAVVCYNDEIATRLISCLQRLGKTIPKDMAVASFDNSLYSEMTTPRITSLSHEPRNAGQEAAQLLIQLMQGKVCQNVTVPWVLVKKEST